MKQYIPWIAIFAIAALMFFVVRRDSKNKAQEPGVNPPSVLSFPCIIEGTFSCPAREVAIAARNASLHRKGFGVEQPDAPDNNDHRNNKVLGGGTPYGGIYLSGSLRFVIDAQGQADPSSYISIFSPERFPVTGGIEINGKVGMASVAGVSIAGEVRDGIVTLKVSESGMDVDTDPTKNDPVWTALSPADKGALDGNRFGSKIQYVHGVVTAGYQKL